MPTMFFWFLLQAFGNPTASHFIKMGLPRLIIQQSEKGLQKNPDDVLSFTTLGIGYARLGQYADAQSAFICGGQSNYEHALEYLADSHRYMMNTTQAVAIRTSLLWDDQTQDQDRVRIYYDIIEDYRFAHQYEQAEEIAEELIGFHPKAMLGWGQMANIAMDRNNVDDAFMYLQLISNEIQNSRRVPKELVYIQARYEYVMGNYDDAHTMIQKTFRAQPTHEGLLWFAKIKRSLYGAQEALQLLERNKFKYNEHPKILQLKHSLYLELQMSEEPLHTESRSQIFFE